MKKYRNLLLGLTIISIGLIASFINLLNLYYFPIGIRFEDIFNYTADIIESKKEAPALTEEEKESLEQLIFPSEKEEFREYTYMSDTPPNALPPGSGPGSPRPLISRPRNAPLHVSKKITPKERENASKKRPPKIKPAPVVEEKKDKNVSTSDRVDLAKPALVSEPVVTASLTTKLIAYFDIEKILSWAANIITIVTGVLIILRKRKED